VGWRCDGSAIVNPPLQSKAKILNLISLNGRKFQLDYKPKQTIGTLCENLTIQFPNSFPKDKDSWFFSLIQNGRALNSNNRETLNKSLDDYIAPLHIVLWVLGGPRKHEKFTNNRITWLHTSASRFAKEGYQCKNCETRRSRLQNGRWASYCGKCTSRFDVPLWWKRVSKRLVRL
jgi:hypothetical protein